MAVITSPAPVLPVTYPESDGKPMAESDLHRNQMVYLIETLKDYFRNDPQVYVAGNLFVYYEEGDPTAVVAPDVFVVLGVPKGDRRVYKVWEEGKGPDLVVEVTSRSTRWEDVGTKRGIYLALGVREYVLFDPLGEYLQPGLQGYRLAEGTYLAPPEYLALPYEAAPEGILRVRSEVLGLVLHAERGWLWLYDPETGERLLSPGEAQEARRAAEVRAAREAEARQAEAEARRAAEERAAREMEARRAAEEEVLRLRAELARLQRTGG